METASNVISDSNSGDWKNMKIDSQEQWDSSFELILLKSKTYELSTESHQDAWLFLMDNAYLKSDELEAKFTCMNEAIRTVPVIQDGCDEWVWVVHKAYELLKTDPNCTYENLKPTLENARRKFTLSYKCPSKYWAAVRFNEVQRLGKAGGPDKHFSLVAGLYKQQFSTPYAGMDRDYLEFLAWAKSVKIDNTVKNAVKDVYYMNAEESLRITDSYPEYLSENETLHYSNFEVWVRELLLKKETDRIVVLCEEKIATQPDNICTYLVYLNALCDEAFNTMEKLHEMIFFLIKRAIRRGRDVCGYTLPRFISHSLLASCLYLTTEEVIDLIHDLMLKFTLEDSLELWFSSRKAILLALTNLVKSNQISPNVFKTKFEELLQPVTMEFFVNNEIPGEASAYNNVEFRLMELFQLYILSEQSILGSSWEETLSQWNGTFVNNINAKTLLSYTGFVRTNGSHEEAVLALEHAVTILEVVNDDGSSSTYPSRKIHLLMLHELLERAADCKRQFQISQELNNRLSSFTQNYQESYDFQSHIFDAVAQQVSSDNLSSYDIAHPGNSEESAYQNDVTQKTSSSDDMSVTGRLKTLFVNPNKVLVKKRGFPIFLVNLAFNTSDEDICSAFREHGLTVVHIDIKRKPKGQNLGFGSVELETKEQAEQALENLDKIKISEREVFVREHKDKDRSRFLKDQPTTLHLEDLPEEWTDPSKIQSELMPFGHIKAVQVYEKSRPASATVEFYMHEDCANAYHKWKNGAVFVNTEIKVKKITGGKPYTGQKRRFESEKTMLLKKKPKLLRGKKDDWNKPSTSSARIPLVPDEEPMPTAPRAPKTRLFVPKQVRRHFKEPETSSMNVDDEFQSDPVSTSLPRESVSQMETKDPSNATASSSSSDVPKL